MFSGVSVCKTAISQNWIGHYWNFAEVTWRAQTAAKFSGSPLKWCRANKWWLYFWKSHKIKRTATLHSNVTTHVRVSSHLFSISPPSLESRRQSSQTDGPPCSLTGTSTSMLLDDPDSVRSLTSAANLGFSNTRLSCVNELSMSKFSAFFAILSFDNRNWLGLSF